MIRQQPRGPRRRFLAPEVLQTSAMDCGPAALTFLLAGFDIAVSYARLQEACQTDLDGTSINTIEQIATTLGLEAEQVMLPVDHLLLASARALPALLVVRRESMTHFVIVWRRHGRLVQLMDPAKGRRWLGETALRDELYLHQQRVAAADWRAWAGSGEFLGSVLERLDALSVTEPARTRLVKSAVSQPSWRPLALLDAATRMVDQLVRAGGVKPGHDAAHVLETITKRGAAGGDLHHLVPASYWSVLPDEGDSDRLILRGAVLLRVLGRGDAETSADASTEAPSAKRTRAASTLSKLTEATERPFAEMWRLVRGQRPIVPALLGAGLLLAAVGALFEIMLLRGILEIGSVLSLREHRLVTIGLVIGVVATLILLDLAISTGILRIGRRVELHLRAALLEKIPRLGDSYFQGRLVSDLAHRAHTLDDLRSLPDVASKFARSAMQLLFTAVALAWLDPPSAMIAFAAAALALAIPLGTQQLLAERELRQRSHSAALTRYYLDSLLGLVAARTHGAERALRHRHESLLVEWGRSSLHLLRGGVVIEGLQLLVGSLLAAWLVLGFVSRNARPGSTLLLVYWTLSLPLLARELAVAIRQFPALRNILARVLEPLSAPDESSSTRRVAPDHAEDGNQAAVAIRFESVQVRLRGRVVLDDVDLSIGAGEHVAVVGRSGAGKSTLAGLLLGWRTPSSGRITIDGVALAESTLAELRQCTAWVDPSVQLWNRSLFDNLRYGDRGAILSNIGGIVEDAELGEILERMPAGLQSSLGEGGGLTSGGEGQRIRFGRALVRRPVRLAILDEPFRGLDRGRRHDLLTRARDIWRGQTMICITHDIEETLAFGRVLVVDDGEIIEDGDPQTLARISDSTYAQLLAAERSVKTDLWGDPRWRRWRLQDGTIAEDFGEAGKAGETTTRCIPERQISPGL